MPDGQAGEEAGAERGGLQLAATPRRAGRRRRPGPARRRRWRSCRRRCGGGRCRGRRRARPPRAGRRREWATPSSTARTSSGRPEPRVRPSSAPRAPKSHCGVPKPSRAGTATTPPVSSQAAATASDSAARADEAEVLDEPVDGRAGRQHDGLDAPGQLAVALPGDDREAAALAAGARSPGRSAPRHTSSMAPVPNVALARPGRVQPWPISDACWSPTRAHSGGAPGRAVAVAERARRVDDRRAARPRGCRAARGRPPASPAPSRLYSPVTAALVASVTWSAPAGQLPRHPAVDRAELGVLALGRGRPAPAARRTWWPTRWARSGCPRPAAPGRCRRCAGPASRGPGRAACPVRASHAMVEARWVVTPDGVDRTAGGQGRVGDVRRGRRHGGGVELHQAGHGHVGGQRHGGARARPSASGSDDRGPDAAGPDVDHQDADGDPSLDGCTGRPVAWRLTSGAHGQGAAPNGDGRPSLPGLRMPSGRGRPYGGQRRRSAAAEVAGAGSGPG